MQPTGTVPLHDETQRLRLGCFALGAARGINGFREVTLASIGFARFGSRHQLAFLMRPLLGAVLDRAAARRPGFGFVAAGRDFFASS
jgi:hypothetical protein